MIRLLPSRLLAGALVVLIMPLATVAQSATDPNDPYENFNRKIFAFNDFLDRWLLKPVAKGYRAVSPQFVENGISNMFENLSDIGTVANDVLQGKWGQAGKDSGRFLINSTIGVAGFFDVADHMGLEDTDSEDFGQTLAVWGVSEGPYVVLPIFGSRTVRDVFGMPVNGVLNPIRYVDHVPTRNTLYGVDVVDTRAGFLEVEKIVSGDRYSYIRDTYLQRRRFLVEDGDVEDDFQSEVDF